MRGTPFSGRDGERRHRLSRRVFSGSVADLFAIVTTRSFSGKRCSGSSCEPSWRQRTSPALYGKSLHWQVALNDTDLVRLL